MTELSFLISLILDEELPLKHKKMIADRVKEVEVTMTLPKPMLPGQMMAVQQSPSTQKILDEMAMNPQPIQAPIPASPVAAQALNSRAEAIRMAASGKTEPGRDRPRKF